MKQTNNIKLSEMDKVFRGIILKKMLRYLKI